MHNTGRNNFCNTKNTLTHIYAVRNRQQKTRLVILGGGESGVGAAILAKDLGMDVFLSDYGNIPENT